MTRACPASWRWRARCIGLIVAEVVGEEIGGDEQEDDIGVFERLCLFLFLLRSRQDLTARPCGDEPVPLEGLQSGLQGTNKRPIFGRG